jgi:flagellar biosynthesis protein FlhA
MLPFLLLAGAAGAGAWARHKAVAEAAAADAPLAEAPAPAAEEDPAQALRIDAIRLELGYGLLRLATGESGQRLTEQIRGLRRSLAVELGYLLPPVRIQDNVQLPPNTYVVRLKEIEAGRAELRPTMMLAMDPRGGPIGLPGERTTEPAFGLPAAWIEETLRDEAAARGYTVVDPASVLVTHLTELVRDHLAELLSFAETQKLIDDLPREHQRLVADLTGAQVGTGTIQRVLQALLAERVSIRDLPTILEGIQDAAGGSRGFSGLLAAVRNRLARQITDSLMGPNGYVPLVTLSAEWERVFAESMVGPPEDRQLAIQPTKLQEFMAKVREVFDRAATMGEQPALLVSPHLRPHIRAIVERFRPSTPVLSQTEVHARARIRTVGTI